MHNKQILKFVYDAQRQLLIGPTGQWSEGQNRNTIAQEHGLSETKYIQKHVSWVRGKMTREGSFRVCKWQMTKNARQ